MSKILFNLHGKQHIVEVEQSGGVTSDAEILHDERLHGPLPNIELGKMEAYDELDDVLDIEGNPQYISELDEEGNIVVTDQIQQKLVRKLRILPSEITSHSEAIAAEQAVRDSIEAKAYLASTDWYIIRELDSGEPCPQEIKDLRSAARLKV